MRYKLWHDSLSLGYPTLDSEHNRLFEIVQQIEEALESQPAPGTTRNLLTQLVDYREDDLHAIFHDTKPCSQELAGWFQEHRAEHNYLADRARAFMAFKNGHERGTLQDLQAFLTRWLADHIQANQRALQVLTPGERER